MFSRKLLFFLIIGVLLVSGLLAACGETAISSIGATSATNTPGSNASQAAPSATTGATQPTTAPVTTNPAPPRTGGAVPKTTDPAANAGAPTEPNPANLDPCSLFTKADFLAVFNKEANDSDKWEGVCDFEFAETLVPGSNEAFGLTIRLDRRTYTPDEFTRLARQLSTQKVDGIGDAAYLKPSESEDESTVLLVLKGKLSFSLELLQPATVTAAQRLDELKAAAQKVLARLATAPVSSKPAPSQPAGSNPASGQTPTPAVDAGGTATKNVVYDPCQLFSQTDFVAIMNSQPQPPQKDEDIAAYSCNYQSATTQDTLSLYVQKETYDKARFEAEWKDQPYTTSEPVKELGDEAVWSDGSVSRLFVLKGNMAFWFELTLENDKTPEQKLDLLKKSATRVLSSLK